MTHHHIHACRHTDVPTGSGLSCCLSWLRRGLCAVSSGFPAVFAGLGLRWICERPALSLPCFRGRCLGRNRDEVMQGSNPSQTQWTVGSWISFSGESVMHTRSTILVSEIDAVRSGTTLATHCLTHGSILSWNAVMRPTWPPVLI